MNITTKEFYNDNIINEDGILYETIHLFKDKKAFRFHYSREFHIATYKIIYYKS